MSKGGISLPPYIVMTIIAVVIIIGIAYIFLTETGKRMLDIFITLSTGSIKNIICGIVPIVGQSLCGG